MKTLILTVLSSFILGVLVGGAMHTASVIRTDCQPILQRSMHLNK